MTVLVRIYRQNVRSLEGPMDARWIHTADIRRITIIGATAHYSSATSFSDAVENEVGRLYPYACLQADAELSPDDHETIWLFCPMISADLNPPFQAATNDIGFSIFPSPLRERQRKESDPK